MPLGPGSLPPAERAQVGTACKDLDLGETVKSPPKLWLTLQLTLWLKRGKTFQIKREASHLGWQRWDWMPTSEADSWAFQARGGRTI